MAKDIIKTIRHYDTEWTAHEVDNYEGPDSPNGSGNTEIEAILDLADRCVERNAREAKTLRAIAAAKLLSV